MMVEGEVIGGLIGVVDRDIYVTNANYVATGTNIGITNNYLRGKFYVGGLVGANFGNIGERRAGVTEINSRIQMARLHVQSAAANTSHYIFLGPTLSNIYGMVVGGIAGFNSGTIQSVEVNFTSAEAFNDLIGGTNPVRWSRMLAVGGIVGENVGSVNQRTGAVIGGILQNNLVATPARINGGFYVGGLIALHRGGGIVRNNRVINPPIIPGAEVQIDESFRHNMDFDSAAIRSAIRVAFMIDPIRNHLGTITTPGRGELKATFTGQLVGFIPTPLNTNQPTPANRVGNSPAWP
jgi:hypothetical protein